MSCWEQLGLTPGADKKSIKLAYAKLLKNTRPDEHPEAFAKLHTAYKLALTSSTTNTDGNRYVKIQHHNAHAKNETSNRVSVHAYEEQADAFNISARQSDSAAKNKRTESENSSEQIEHLETPLHAVRSRAEEPDSTVLSGDLNTPETDNKPDNVINADQVFETHVEQFLDQVLHNTLEKDWRVMEQTLQLVLQNSRRANNVDEWRFIESIPSMTDLEFSRRTSLLIFQQVSDVNASALRKGTLWIKQPVLKYLNERFQWEYHWQELQQKYGEHNISAVFPFLHDKTSKIDVRHRSLHYFSRIVAFLIDLLIPVSCTLISTQSPTLSLLPVVGYTYILLILPVMEASPWQASLGKRLLKLAVVDRNGLRLRWHHSFIRSVVTLCCLIGIKFVVWINLFTSYKYNLLLQDAITRSYVIKRK